jgi:hypothetical protein
MLDVFDVVSAVVVALMRTNSHPIAGIIVHTASTSESLVVHRVVRLTGW